MKKLLSMLAVSTLIGTSASNLKPLLINSVVSHGFKSNQVNNKDIIIQGENDTNPFISKIIDIDTNETVTCSIIANNGIIYVGTAFLQGSLPASKLYKSTDGINFIELKSWNQDYGKGDTIKSLAIINNTIYVGTYNSVYKSTDGVTFTPMSGTIGMIKSLVVDSSNNIYAGTDYGLYKSTGGTEFIKVNIKEVKSSVNSLYIFNNILYIGNNNGLYKSNNGADFEQLKGIPNKFFVYSISIAPDGTIYAGTNHGLYKSTDGVNFRNNDIRGKAKRILIINISITDSGNIYIGTVQGLYKSNNGADFELVDIKTRTSNQIISLAIINNTIYVGTYDKDLYAINLIERLIKISKPDTFDKSWRLYNGIVYDSIQKIDIKENLVASATLDGKLQTVPKIGLDIPVGEHNLILTLKDKTLASVFGGDPNTGQVTYRLWVKTSIDKNKIDYQTKIDDTQLYTGLVSNTGNTNNADIIQTKIKNGTGTHNASINIDFKDILIDFDINKSFYVQGTVDETTNNFTATGSKQKITKNLEIKIDGTYHLHLVDTVGNNYDNYLELGESNWKLKGTFNDKELNKLKTKLNVEVNLRDQQQLARANGWLSDYKKIVTDLFEKSLQANGKGFDQDISKDLEKDFKWFLKPLTYLPDNEPKFDDGIDNDKLNSEVTKIAQQKLQDSLTDLPKNLNIDFKNVTDKQTLDNCKTWSNNYEKYIKDNVSKWITDISNVASRGFTTPRQMLDIKKYINHLPFNKYLKAVEWTPNLTASGYDNKYLQYVELDKLQSDTIAWVNQNMPEINQAYQNAINVAESDVNLHGYNIDTLLNGKKMPQTKSEIEKFADGQSFHNWLQSQANIKFHGWQLTMGLGIGILLFVIALGIAWFVRKATDQRYNPFAWERKKEKQLSKSAKSSKINKIKNDEK